MLQTLFNKLSVSFPFYKQHDFNDCGPTCIRIICSYYKKTVSIQSLRDLCNIDREGVSIKAIKTSCKEIGFDSEAIKFTIQKEKEVIPSLDELPLPAILHWDSNHFVVVYKVTEDKVYISDPAKGKVALGRDNVKKYVYSGNNFGKVILMEPNDRFYSLDNRFITSGNFQKKKNFVKSHILRSQSKLKFVFLLILGQIIFQSISPFLTQKTFDGGILGKDKNILLWILVIQLGIFLLTSLVSYLQNVLSNQVAEAINHSMISDFVKKIFKISLDFYFQKKSSDFLQRVQDLNRIESFLVYNFSSILIALIGVVVMTVIALYYDVNTFFIFVSYNFIYALWMYFVLRKKRALDYEQYDIGIFRHRHLVEMIQGFQEIKLGGNASSKTRLFLENQKKFFANSLKNIKITQSLSIGGGLIKQIGYGYITFYTAIQTINGTLTIGEMAAIQLVISQLDMMLANVFSSTTMVQEVVFSLERILEIESIPEEASGEKEVGHSMSIALSKVNFFYNRVSNRVLRDIDITFEEGKTTAIVGASGSGKTTLLKIALSLCSPTSGEILLNGNNIKEYNIKSWRKKCGVVMQDGFIFTDTIINNVTQTDDKIDFERYENALKLAELFDFVSDLPIKHETLIGTEALPLSSGQKQRILIARLIYKEPSYIFMDEATNSLDSETENKVVRNIDAYFEGSTKIIVAHRLSTVKRADKIVVMDNGEIIECGSHYELISQQGKYYSLIHEQLELS